MILDLLLLFVCAASGVLLWRSVRAYAPRLVVFSEHEITERLHEDSARFLLILMHFRTFWRGRHYRDFFLHLVGKMILKSHILILRLDNALVRLLQKIRSAGAFASGANGMGEYVRHLRERQDGAPRTRDPLVPRGKVRIAVPVISSTDRVSLRDEQNKVRTPDAVRVRHRTLHIAPKWEEGMRQQQSSSRPHRIKIEQQRNDSVVKETNEQVPT
ncbi:MAG: hypothetical protein Q8Q94_02950 [bacterium]|nr:hypothetical protein [bacterium]